MSQPSLQQTLNEPFSPICFQQKNYSQWPGKLLKGKTSSTWQTISLNKKKSVGNSQYDESMDTKPVQKRIRNKNQFSFKKNTIELARLEQKIKSMRTNPFFIKRKIAQNLSQRSKDRQNNQSQSPNGKEADFTAGFIIQAKTYPAERPLEATPNTKTTEPQNQQAQPRKGLKDVIYGRRAKQLNLDNRVRHYPSPPPELKAVALKKQNADINIGAVNQSAAKSATPSSMIMPSYHSISQEHPSQINIKNNKSFHNNSSSQKENSSRFLREQKYSAMADKRKLMPNILLDPQQ